MTRSFWAVCTVLIVARSVTAQFDLFGATSGPGHGGFFDFGATADPYGYGSGNTAPTPTDPSARDARLTAAEEQMAEAMSETGKNSPERQRIEQLIHLSGGRFAGDAANLNYLVEEYMMTTPGPSTPSPPPEREGPPPKKKGAMKGKGRGGGGKGKRGGGKGGGKMGQGVGGKQRGQGGFGQNQKGSRKGGQGQGRAGRGQRGQRGQQQQQQQYGGYTQQPLGANPALSMGQHDQWGPVTPDPWADQPGRGQGGGRQGRQNQFDQGPVSQWDTPHSNPGASSGGPQQSILAPGDPAPGGMSPAEFDRFVMEQWTRLQENLQKAGKSSNDWQQTGSSSTNNNQNHWNQPPQKAPQMNNNYQVGNNAPGKGSGQGGSNPGWNNQGSFRNGPNPRQDNFGKQVKGSGQNSYAGDQTVRQWNDPAQSNWGPPQGERGGQPQRHMQDVGPWNEPPPQRRRGRPNTKQSPDAGHWDQPPQVPKSRRRQQPMMPTDPQPTQQPQRPVYQPDPQSTQQPNGPAYQQEQHPQAQFKKQPPGRGAKLSPAAERLKRIQVRINSAQEQLKLAQANPQNADKIANIVSQIEALLSVRSILTGNAKQPASVQTLKRIPEATGQANAFPKQSATSPTPYPAENRNGNQGPTNINMPPPTFRKENPQAAGAGLLEGATVKKGPPPQRWGPPPQVDMHPQAANSFGPPVNYNGEQQPFIPPMPRNIPQSRSLRSTAVPKHRRRDIIELNRQRKNSRFEMNQALAKTGAIKARMLGRVAMSGTSANTKILSPQQMDGALKTMGQNATTKAPIEGETRMIGQKRYVFTDADGFDTFQWVLNTGPPPTPKPVQSSSISPIDQQTTQIVDAVPNAEQLPTAAADHIPAEPIPKAQII